MEYIEIDIAGKNGRYHHKGKWIYFTVVSNYTIQWETIPPSHIDKVVRDKFNIPAIED